ncbi:MAG: hypothetical protein SO164_00260 [Campylobacter sp.]|nr:hypothetical protein [Campylobacter sp.]MDY4860546.1 hypothetical protein [Campylobacter sp.]
MDEKIALHSAFVRGGFVVWFCGALCDFCGRHGKINTQAAKSTRKIKLRER